MLFSERNEERISTSITLDTRLFLHQEWNQFVSQSILGVHKKEKKLKRNRLLNSQSVSDATYWKKSSMDCLFSESMAQFTRTIDQKSFADHFFGVKRLGKRFKISVAHLHRWEWDFGNVSGYMWCRDDKGGRFISIYFTLPRTKWALCRRTQAQLPSRISNGADTKD